MGDFEFPEGENMEEVLQTLTQEQAKLLDDIVREKNKEDCSHMNGLTRGFYTTSILGEAE